MRSFILLAVPLEARSFTPFDHRRTLQRHDAARSAWAMLPVFYLLYFVYFLFYV